MIQDSSWLDGANLNPSSYIKVGKGILCKKITTIIKEETADHTY